MKGTIYMIPCPIADSESVWDVLPKANLEVMNSLDYFIVENTRSARRFLSKAGIERKIDELEFVELNEHTVSPHDIERMLRPVLEGRSAGVISEAGVPGVADPGADIVALAHRNGIRVVPLVGPSSILMVMMASGQNGQSFAFNGYLPIKEPDRSRTIRNYERRAQQERQAQIFIEAPYRKVLHIDNGDGTHYGDCIRCDKTTTAAAHTYENGVCTACGEGGTSEPVYDDAVKFSHSLTLENDISINFIGLGSALIGYDSFYLECKVPVYNGNELVGYETVKIDPVYNGKNYECTLLGVTAKMMNDEIEAVFHMTKDGQEYYSKTDVYSVAEYAYGKLDSTKATDTAELKTVCANLLRYGSMAQIQFNYRTDALVDADMTATHKSYLTDLSKVEMKSYMKQLSDLPNFTVPWKSATLELGNKVIMCLIANLSSYNGDPSELTMRLSYIDSKGQNITVERPLKLYDEAKMLYAVSYDGLRATEMRTIVSAAIYLNGTRVSKTVEYSIESYGGRNPSDLCRAMLAYGDSANAFFAN